MNYGSIKLADCANGPGMRTSLFVSGCRHHCKGCFNRETWDFDYGNPYTRDTEAYILSTIEEDYVDGLSILGGEPFERENQLDVYMLAFGAYEIHKSVWIYTGYTWEELMTIGGNFHMSIIGIILAYTDVLVDGPFVEAEKDISLRFRGSRNQRIIDVQASLDEGRVVLAEEWM